MKQIDYKTLMENINLYEEEIYRVCHDCGEIIERDYNAALNIRDEGIRLIS